MLDEATARSRARRWRAPAPTAGRPATTTARPPAAAPARPRSARAQRPTARRTTTPGVGITSPSTQLAGSSAGSVSSQRKTASRHSSTSTGTANSVSQRVLARTARDRSAPAMPSRLTAIARPAAVSTARRCRGERHSDGEEELDQRAVERTARQPAPAACAPTTTRRPAPLRAPPTPSTRSARRHSSSVTGTHATADRAHRPAPVARAPRTPRGHATRRAAPDTARGTTPAARTPSTPAGRHRRTRPRSAMAPAHWMPSSRPVKRDERQRLHDDGHHAQPASLEERRHGHQRRGQKQAGREARGGNGDRCARSGPSPPAPRRSGCRRAR